MSQHNCKTSIMSSMPEGKRNRCCKDDLHYSNNIYPMPFCQMDSKYLRNDHGNNKSTVMYFEIV